VLDRAHAGMASLPWWRDAQWMVGLLAAWLVSAPACSGSSNGRDISVYAEPHCIRKDGATSQVPGLLAHAA
jgi:hypothetical protein